MLFNSFRVRNLVQESVKFFLHSRQHKLLPADVDLALKMQGLSLSKKRPDPFKTKAAAVLAKQAAGDFCSMLLCYAMLSLQRDPQAEQPLTEHTDRLHLLLVQPGVHGQLLHQGTLPSRWAVPPTSNKKSICPNWRVQRANAAAVAMTTEMDVIIS
jgi:TATA box binding protein associated factor (TAF)